MDFLGPATIFYVLAWAGTAMALLFLILMFFGLDDVLDGWFIQRVAVAFACGFGWTGVVLSGEGYGLSATLGISVLVGLGLSGLLVSAILFLRRLGDSAHQELGSLVGKVGEVVASVPGEIDLKVRVLFQGRLQEMMASKKDPSQNFSVGVGVRVESVLPTGKLVVDQI